LGSTEARVLLIYPAPAAEDCSLGVRRGMPSRRSTIMIIAIRGSLVAGEK
jgi:hypothetical protein